MIETIRNYFSLTKPKILLMVLVTTAIGYFSANGNSSDSYTLFFTLMGVALAGAGSSALNMVLEHDIDRKMERTLNRPIATGKIKPMEGILFGIATTLLSMVILISRVHLLVAFLTLLTSFLYVLVYTPMKRVTILNTSFGAIPGALPPLIGWSAATHALSIKSLILFLILFLWQHPHFYAIAWIFRKDYTDGGLKMLSVEDPTGSKTGGAIITFTILLLIASLIPSFIGITGAIYMSGAFMMGLYFLLVGLRYMAHRTQDHARSVLKVSLIYLPILFILILMDGRL